MEQNIKQLVCDVSRRTVRTDTMSPVLGGGDPFEDWYTVRTGSRTWHFADGLSALQHLNGPQRPHTPCITLTGIDHRTDMEALRSLPVELGFLFSLRPKSHRHLEYKTLLRKAEQCAHAALHVCGLEARQWLLDGNIATTPFRRIQINGKVTARELEAVCEKYPEHQIITQYAKYNWELVQLALPNHEMLVDESGGRGILPDIWGRPPTMRPVGYAGGLSADNLASVFPELPLQGYWWIDMEQSLRDDDDLFSVDRAIQTYMVFRSVAERAGYAV